MARSVTQSRRHFHVQLFASAPRVVRRGVAVTVRADVLLAVYRRTWGPIPIGIIANGEAPVLGQELLDGSKIWIQSGLRETDHSIRLRESSPEFILIQLTDI